MDNFKYSVKTQQFGKKRHQIFSKDVQKQSMSLQVHEPSHNVSHLLSLTKSEDQNTLTQFWKQPSQQYQIYESAAVVQQQKRTVKFNKSSTRKPTLQQSKSRTKIHHDIVATAKVSIPVGMQSSNSQSAHTNHVSISTPELDHLSIKYQFPHNPQQSRIYQSNTPAVVQIQPSYEQLQLIKVTLINNEQKLQQLTSSLNNLYKSVIDLYSNHELKMKELVNHRCYQIVNIFKTALIQLHIKQRQVQQIDNKVNVLINTVKDSKQILRIVKIKQQCIEAMQKSKQSRQVLPAPVKDSQRKSTTSQMQLSSSSYTNNTASQNAKQTVKCQRTPSENTKRTSYQNKQDINYSLDFSLLSNKHNEAPKQIHQLPSKQFKMITCQAENDSQSVATSFINSPKKSQAKQLSQFKKSPFEANQLFQISNTMPSIPKIHEDIFAQKQSEYSFRKPVLDNYSSFYYHPKVKNEHRAPGAKSFTNQPQSNTYDRLKKNLYQLMQNSASKEVWLDNLQCLRRKNGTYLLDTEGNAVICSQLQYEKLLKDGVVIASQF